MSKPNPFRKTRRGPTALAWGIFGLFALVAVADAVWLIRSVRRESASVPIRREGGRQP